MVQTQKQPTFVLPGLIWRFTKWISPLVFAFVAFVAIAGFGYWFACFLLTHEGWTSLVDIFLIGGMLYAPIYVLLTRKRPRTLRSYTLTPAAFSGCVFALVLILHYARPSFIQLGFVDSDASRIEMNAPTPGFRELAFTFRGDFGQVAARADSELRRMGFEVSRKEAHFDANFGVARWEPAYPSKGVSIYPGRASGKYFLVDGDALDIEPTAGWVTVDLFEEDVYPLWLGLFIP